MISTVVKKPTGPELHRKLGDAVRERRSQLRMTQGDVMAKGGPSQATIRHIESGEQQTYRRATLLDLEAALDWPMGTVDAILDGREPPQASTPERVDVRDIHIEIKRGGFDRTFVVPEGTSTDTILGAIRALLDD